MVVQGRKNKSSQPEVTGLEIVDLEGLDLEKPSLFFLCTCKCHHSTAADLDRLILFLSCRLHE